ncbi:hypothetical protein [Actinomadura kijaniata]|nr:hypothetical protein [Actinomadura kijaniata]
MPHQANDTIVTGNGQGASSEDGGDAVQGAGQNRTARAGDTFQP